MGTDHPAIATKLCNDCQHTKPISEFTTYTTELGRRFRPYCKPCATLRTQAWRTKTRQPSAAAS